MNKISILLMFVFCLSSISAIQVCNVYDDFSSGVLDNSKWVIRQDVEGQPFTDIYNVDSELKNFHMQQITTGDKRTYLVPKHSFTTGDVLEYDFNVISKTGNYMQFDLLTGDQYIRLGIMGYLGGVQGYDELGVSHVKIEFQENNLHLERTTPSGIVLVDNLALTKTNGNYELYLGTVFTNLAHIDFDNFKICSEQPEPTCEDRVKELEAQVEDLQSQINILESIFDKLESYLFFLKHSAKKDLLCNTLEETGEVEIKQYGMHCLIKEQPKGDSVCKCENI